MKIKTVPVRAGARALASAALCAMLPFGSAQASATTVSLDVAGIADVDKRGAETNIVKELFVGAGASIDTFRWDVTLTSNDPSYLSEMQVTFSDSLGYGVTFTPGGGDDFQGTRSYAGFQDLRVLGQQFRLGQDGMLRLEFHDAYKDLDFDQPDGLWNAGTLTFGVSPVPEPATVALMLAGLVLVAGVHRRRAAAAPSP